MVVSKRLVVLLGLGAVASLVSFSVLALDWNNPEPPKHLKLQFPYQGVLERDGALVNGVVEFRLSLWNKANPGAAGEVKIWPSGSNHENHSVVVGNGRFALSVGSVTQIESRTLETNSPDLFLEIQVKIPGLDDDFVRLDTRQQVLSTPYAINSYRAQYAEVAWTANSASNAAHADSVYGQVPIGGIIAFHKNLALANAASMPGEWVECNGQTINFPGSVFHNQPAPNLNGIGGQPGRYLRGSTASGEMQDDSIRSHSHPYVDHHFWLKDTNWAVGGGPWPDNGTGMNTPVTQETTDVVGVGETRPYTFTVVWIMRVY